MAFGLAADGRRVHGEHKDGNLGQERFNGCGRLQAIHLRHGKVQDDKVRLELRGLSDGLAAGHSIAADFPSGVRFKHAADSAQHGLVIVGNEDAFQPWEPISKLFQGDCRAPYRVKGRKPFGAF